MSVQVVCGASSIRYFFLADSTLCLCIVQKGEICPDFTPFPAVTHFLGGKLRAADWLQSGEADC